MIVAKGKKVKASTPLITEVKDPFTRDVNPASFNYYTILHGLKNDVIYSLQEDNYGNIWISTLGGGITKFDGRYFSIYTEKEGLISNSILCSIIDKNGCLWLGTDEGVSVFDGTQFTNYTKEDGLADNFVESIFQDKKGNVWIGTSHGLSCFDGVKFTNYFKEQGMIIGGEVGAGISSICQDKKGNIWLGGYGGLCCFNNNSFKVFNNKNGLNEPYVSKIHCDRNNRLWLTGNNLAYFENDTFYNFGESNGFINDSPTSIYETKSGDIWIGGYGSVTLYNGQYFKHFNNQDGFGSNKYVMSIIEDKRGGIWMGSEEGLYKYNGDLFTHIHLSELFKLKYKELEGSSNRFLIKSISQDNEGNLWLGSDGTGIYKLKDNTVFECPLIYLIFKPKLQLVYQRG